MINLRPNPSLTRKPLKPDPESESKTRQATRARALGHSAAAAALPAPALALAVAAHLQAQSGHDLQGAVRWLYALCRLRLAATLRRYRMDHGRASFLACLGAAWC